jgi:CheY-like chemotaxis protein
MKIRGDELESPAVLRVLIVEDTPRRQELLQQLYREHAWVLASDALHAVRLVAAYDFDLISLDYDLEGLETGELVAEAVAASRNASTPVIVHSMNPEGAELVSIVLPHAQRVPVDQMVGSHRSAEAVRQALREGVPKDWRSVLAHGESSVPSES